MEEMIYGDIFSSKHKSILGRLNKILDSDEYEGIKYYIVNTGTHPTAYIEVKPEFEIYDYNDVRLDSIKVHGGFTYYGVAYWNIHNDNDMYIGWDYAHYGDYVAFGPNFRKEKEWTTSEILDEVYSVIDQINTLFDRN